MRDQSWPDSSESLADPINSFISSEHKSLIATQMNADYCKSKEMLINVECIGLNWSSRISPKPPRLGVNSFSRLPDTESSLRLTSCEMLWGIASSLFPARESFSRLSSLPRSSGRRSRKFPWNHTSCSFELTLHLNLGAVYWSYMVYSH